MGPWIQLAVSADMHLIQNLLTGSKPGPSPSRNSRSNWPDELHQSGGTVRITIIRDMAGFSRQDKQSAHMNNAIVVQISSGDSVGLVKQ